MTDVEVIASGLPILNAWGDRIDEWNTLMTGSPNGGAEADGRYPMTLRSGGVVQVPCASVGSIEGAIAFDHAGTGLAATEADQALLEIWAKASFDLGTLGVATTPLRTVDQPGTVIGTLTGKTSGSRVEIFPPNDWVTLAGSDADGWTFRLGDGQLAAGQQIRVGLRERHRRARDRHGPYLGDRRSEAVFAVAATGLVRLTSPELRLGVAADVALIGRTAGSALTAAIGGLTIDGGRLAGTPTKPGFYRIEEAIGNDRRASTLTVEPSSTAGTSFGFGAAQDPVDLRDLHAVGQELIWTIETMPGPGSYFVLCANPDRSSELTIQPDADGTIFSIRVKRDGQFVDIGGVRFFRSTWTDHTFHPGDRVRVVIDSYGVIRVFLTQGGPEQQVQWLDYGAAGQGDNPSGLGGYRLDEIPLSIGGDQTSAGILFGGGSGVRSFQATGYAQPPVELTNVDDVGYEAAGRSLRVRGHYLGNPPSIAVTVWDMDGRCVVPARPLVTAPAGGSFDRTIVLPIDTTFNAATMLVGLTVPGSPSLFDHKALTMICWGRVGPTTIGMNTHFAAYYDPLAGAFRDLARMSVPTTYLELGDPGQVGSYVGEYKLTFAHNFQDRGLDSRVYFGEPGTDNRPTRLPDPRRDLGLLMPGALPAARAGRYIVTHNLRGLTNIYGLGVGAPEPIGEGRFAIDVTGGDYQTRRLVFQGAAMSLPAGEPLTISIVREDEVRLRTAFNGTAIEDLRDISRIIRWMTTLNTNVEARHDIGADDLSFSRFVFGDGSSDVGLDVVVDTCNAAACDLWINIHHRLTDAGIRALATYIHDHLSPSLRIYLEWSNETWNPNFPVLRRSIEEGYSAGFNADVPDPAWQPVSYPHLILENGGASYTGPDGETVEPYLGYPGEDVKAGEYRWAYTPGLSWELYRAKVDVPQGKAGKVPNFQQTSDYWQHMFVDGARCMNRWKAHRSKAAFAIFDDVFGGAARARIVRVLMGWRRDTNPTSYAEDLQIAVDHEELWRTLDVVGVDTYTGLFERNRNAATCPFAGLLKTDPAAFRAAVVQQIATDIADGLTGIASMKHAHERHMRATWPDYEPNSHQWGSYEGGTSEPAWGGEWDYAALQAVIDDIKHSADGVDLYELTPKLIAEKLGGPHCMFVMYAGELPAYSEHWSIMRYPGDRQHWAYQAYRRFQNTFDPRLI